MSEKKQQKKNKAKNQVASQTAAKSTALQTAAKSTASQTASQSAAKTTASQTAAKSTASQDASQATTQTAAQSADTSQTMQQSVAASQTPAKSTNDAKSAGNAKSTPKKARTAQSLDLRPYLSDVTSIFAFVMLAIFPLLMGTGGYTDITESKYYWFLALSGIFAATLIIVTAVMRSKARVKLNEKEFFGGIVSALKSTGIAGAVIGFYVLWNTISAIASEYEDQTFIGMSRYEGWLSLFVYALIMILVMIYGHYTDVLFIGMSVSAIIFGLIAFMQVMGSTMLYPDGYDYWGSTFITTVGHQDCYGGLVSIAIPVLVAGYVLTPEKKIKKFDLRLPAIPALFLLSYTFFYTDVDSGKLGLAAAFAVTLAFLVDTRKHLARFLQALAPMLLGLAYLWGWNNNQGTKTFIGGKKFILALVCTLLFAAAGILLERAGFEFKLSPQKIRIAVAILIVLAVIAVLIFVYSYSGSATLIKEMSEALHGRLDDRAGSYRGYIWKATVQIIKENGILGSGPGTFAGEFEPYNAGYSAYIPNTIVDFAHNDFLQIAVCSGIIGLLAYVAFIVILVVKALFAPKEKRDTCIILLSGIIGYLAHSFFGFSIAIVTPLYWVLAGLLLAQTRRNN